MPKFSLKKTKIFEPPKLSWHKVKKGLLFQSSPYFFVLTLFYMLIIGGLTYVSAFQIAHQVHDIAQAEGGPCDDPYSSYLDPLCYGGYEEPTDPCEEVCAAQGESSPDCMCCRDPNACPPPCGGEPDPCTEPYDYSQLGLCELPPDCTPCVGYGSPKPKECPPYETCNQQTGECECLPEKRCECDPSVADEIQTATEAFCANIPEPGNCQATRPKKKPTCENGQITSGEWETVDLCTADEICVVEETASASSSPQVAGDTNGGCEKTGPGSCVKNAPPTISPPGNLGIVWGPPFVFKKWLAEAKKAAFAAEWVPENIAKQQAPLFVSDDFTEAKDLQIKIEGRGGGYSSGNISFDYNIDKNVKVDEPLGKLFAKDTGINGKAVQESSTDQSVKATLCPKLDKKKYYVAYEHVFKNKKGEENLRLIKKGTAYLSSKSTNCDFPHLINEFTTKISFSMPKLGIVDLNKEFFNKSFARAKERLKEQVDFFNNNKVPEAANIVLDDVWKLYCAQNAKGQCVDPSEGTQSYDYYRDLISVKVEISGQPAAEVGNLVFSNIKTGVRSATYKISRQTAIKYMELYVLSPTMLGELDTVEFVKIQKKVIELREPFLGIGKTVIVEPTKEHEKIVDPASDLKEPTSKNEPSPENKEKLKKIAETQTICCRISNKEKELSPQAFLPASLPRFAFLPEAPGAPIDISTLLVDSDNDKRATLQDPLPATLMSMASSAPGEDILTSELDCDDTRADVYPGARDIVGNGIDENCDGEDVEAAADPSRGLRISAPPVGFLQSIDSAKIIGWAYDPDTPAKSIKVHLFANGPKETGTKMGVFDANIFRADVNQDKGITGSHGFSVPLPATYKAKGVALYAYAEDAQDRSLHLLANSPLTYTNPPPIGKFESIAKITTGWRRFVTFYTLSGWAYDPDLSESAIVIHLYAYAPLNAPNSRRLVGFSTAISRPDINQAYNIKGRHGFSYTVNILNAWRIWGLPSGTPIYAYAYDPLAKTLHLLDGSPLYWP